MDRGDKRKVGFEGWMRLQALFLWVTWSGYVVWPGAQGADPVPVPKWGQVPRGKTAKCRGSAQGPERPARGPPPRKREPVDAKP